MHEKQSKNRQEYLKLCENQTFPLAVDEEPLLRDNFGKTLLFPVENKTRVESALCSSIYTDIVGPWSPLTSWPITSKVAPPQWSPNESAHHPEQPALSHIPLPSRLSAWSLTQANGFIRPPPGPLYYSAALSGQLCLGRSVCGLCVCVCMREVVCNVKQGICQSWALVGSRWRWGAESSIRGPN